MSKIKLTRWTFWRNSFSFSSIQTGTWRRMDLQLHTYVVNTLWSFLWPCSTSLHPTFQSLESELWPLPSCHPQTPACCRQRLFSPPTSTKTSCGHRWGVECRFIWCSSIILTDKHNTPKPITQNQRLFIESCILVVCSRSELLAVKVSNKEFLISSIYQAASAEIYLQDIWSEALLRSCQSIWWHLVTLYSILYSFFSSKAN